MDAKEEMRRFGYCTLDPAKHVKDEEAFWAGIRKQRRLMRHNDIRSEVEFNATFSRKPARRYSFRSNLALLLPVLLVAVACVVAAWRLSVLLPN